MKKDNVIKRLGMEKEFKKWSLNIKMNPFLVGANVKLIKTDSTVHSSIRKGTVGQIIGERTDGDIGRFLVKISGSELYFNTEEMPIYFKRV